MKKTKKLHLVTDRVRVLIITEAKQVIGGISVTGCQPSRWCTTGC